MRETREDRVRTGQEGGIGHLRFMAGERARERLG